MTKEQRRDIQESKKIIEGSWDTKKIADLIPILQELLLKGFTDVELGVEHSYYDEVRPVMKVKKIRKETDIEYNERIKKQQMAEAARERAQRLEYEKLFNPELHKDDMLTCDGELDKYTFGDWLEDNIPDSIIDSFELKQPEDVSGFIVEVATKEELDTIWGK